MYKNILVPIDPEHPESAARAFEVARRFARSVGASLNLVSVHPGIVDNKGAVPGEFRRKLAAFVKKHGGMADVREVRELDGSACADIHASTEDLGADLIVMDSRDPHFTDCLIGPEATHVAMFTPCSVLLVR